MKAIAGIIITMAFLFLSGCSHDPVYPTVGSLYISTNPAGAEIFIDGKTTGRMTPVKIDGITVGLHQITLKYYRCKNWTQQAEIKPGQTTRLQITMANISPAIIQNYSLAAQPGDMAYEPRARKIYVSFPDLVNYITVLSLGDSTIVGNHSINIGSFQTAIAANMNADRIYTSLDSVTIAAIGLTSELLVKTFTFGYTLHVSDIVFSYDGLSVYVANAANNSIFIIDALKDSLVKTIELDGSPSEVTGDMTGNYLYVAFKDDRALSKIDINTGAVVASTATGNDPMGLFWDKDYQTIGLCNSSDRSLLLADANNLATATSPVFIYGEIIPAACLSMNGDHLWAVESYITPNNGEEPPFPGLLGLLYKPTWRFVDHYDIGIMPTKIAQSPDGRFLYILEERSRDILVVRTDIMN